MDPGVFRWHESALTVTPSEKGDKMKKRLLFSCVTLAALGGVWLAAFNTRPALAQQARPPEGILPRAFGTLKVAEGWDDWFEAPDGTIRRITLHVDQSGTVTYDVVLVLHRT